MAAKTESTHEINIISNSFNLFIRGVIFVTRMVVSVVNSFFFPEVTSSRGVQQESTANSQLQSTSDRPEESDARPIARPENDEQQNVNTLYSTHLRPTEPYSAPPLPSSSSGAVRLKDTEQSEAIFKAAKTDSFIPTHRSNSPV